MYSFEKQKQSYQQSFANGNSNLTLGTDLRTTGKMLTNKSAADRTDQTLLRVKVFLREFDDNCLLVLWVVFINSSDLYVKAKN